MPSCYALGKDLETFVRQQVETGRYASASEVVCDALKLLKDRWEQREAALEALRGEMDKGLVPGETHAAEEVFESLKQKYRELDKPSVRRDLGFPN